MSKLLLINFILLLTVITRRQVNGGCYQRRLCCPGRNNSCVAYDDGISHIPMIYPADVQSDQAAGRRHDESGQPNEDDDEGPATMVEKRKDKKKLKWIKFGEKFMPKDQPEEVVEKDGRDPIIRYRLVNVDIPVMEGFTSESSEEKENESSRYGYMESAGESIMECYCDEYCVRFGDCCSDYPLACPVQDCEVYDWADWSACVPDDTAKKCGSGVQTRIRHIGRHPTHGGQECPPLEEKRTCFKECPRKSRGTTTVALLLDYKYQAIGESDVDPGQRYVHEDVDPKTLKFYCVKYKLGWVNQNCVDPKITAMLYKGNVICAECQPDSQWHRPDARCASDLDDGDVGFWKLIGPKSCNGIWTRLSRVDDCRCGREFNQTDSFLLV